jgi:hypothetical protein
MNVPKEEYDPEWNQILKKLKDNFGKTPDINGILFLIGVHELGKGFQSFSKEQKQDLMHVGTCAILSSSGYYRLEGLDNEGWPIFSNLKSIPKFSLEEQEYFIKTHIKEYFSKIDFK